MSNRIVLIVALALMLPHAAHAQANPPLSATELRCEMREGPLGIDTPKPRLSWMLTSPAAGEMQTAYQVLVATKKELLQPGQADLWDSGKVESDQSIHIEYAGKPLTSSQQIVWTVRANGKEGRQSDWAPAATWTMGLLAPNDWKAKWITDGRWKKDVAQAIERAKWIWFPEARVEPPTKDVPPGTRYFRRVFSLPAGVKIADARMQVAVDNEAVVELNGQKVGTQDNWGKPTTFDVGKLLLAPGENVVTIAATNTTDKPNPAALIVAITVPRDAGDAFELLSDKTWEARETPTAEWKQAKVVAKWGEGPWKSADAAGPHPPLPIFRKAFDLNKPIKRAIVHVSGLGHYKLYVNGKPVGEDFLDPAWSKYQKTIYYNTFDITPLLKQGGNAIGAMLGKSYYSTRGDRRIHAGVFDNPTIFIAQAEVEYEDGSTTQIATDDGWRWTSGPYTHDSIIGGVDYDARQLPDHWAEASFDESKWSPAPSIDPKLGQLAAAVSPPLRMFEQYAPVSVNEPAPGHYVYDFGQNASATLKLKVKGPAGATLRLVYGEQRHGETLHRNDGHGTVDQSGIGAPNYIEYTLKGGGEESWFCNLFYSGFQYIELTGGVPEGFASSDGKPVITDIRSIHVRANAERIGSFGCSNNMYEKIDRMIDWSVRSNLSHVLTDCPHREKLGWLEVPHLMWDSMAYRFDLSSFGPKVSNDIKDSQADNGQIPTVAPSYSAFGGAFGYTPEWGAAGVEIPYYVYQWYGDKRNLQASYPMMKAFVDYLRKSATDGLVPAAGLGDWYDYGHGQALGPSKFTPVDLTAMAIFHDCTVKVAESAKVLGNSDDEQKYRALAADIRKDFNQRYYDGKGTYKNNGSCQTANAMALVCGLVEPAEQEKVAEKIVEDLKGRGYQQTSGDVGFHYLVRALTDFGKSDALFAILNRDQPGSYAYLVNAGWTSLPEAWDADHHSSMNHCMLGHIQEWFNRDLAGIQPTSVAFKTFRIRPTPGPGVTAASASLRCAYGWIGSSWKIDEKGKFTLDAIVPPNTTAHIRLPGSAHAVQVGSGTHHFEAQIPATEVTTP